MSDLDFSAVPPDQLQSVLNGPAIPPPAGVVPNFDNPVANNGIALFALLFCSITTSIAFVLRIYARFWKLRKQHLGDYIIIAAYLIYISLIVGSVHAVALGQQFVHEWDIRGKNVGGYLRSIFISVVLYSVAILLVKTAILIEWIRVFVPLPTRNWFYWTCLSIMGINLLFYIIVLIFWGLACRPFSRTWDKTVPGHCLDMKIPTLVTAIINFVLDVAILLLPQRIIWRLNMPRKEKLGVSAVFTIGIAACLSAAFRIQATLGWVGSRDMTYHFSAIALWALAEITCAILVFSIPAIPMAFKGFQAPMWFSAWRSWALSSVKKLRTTDKGSGAASSDTDLVVSSHQESQFIRNEPGLKPVLLGSFEGVTQTYHPQGEPRANDVPS